MSYQSSKYLKHDPNNPVFSAGYIDNTPEHLIPESASPYLRNSRIFGQTTTIRPGHSLLKNIGGTGAPKGLGIYNRVGSSNDRIVVRQNIDGTHKLTTLDTVGTQVDISTGALIASDNFMQFTNGQDVIYAMNGSDSFGVLNGTTYTTPSTNVYVKTFTGSGLNDMNVTFAGDGAQHTYIVTVDGTGTPDTFKWNIDGGAYTTGVNMVAGSSVTLTGSFTFNFTASTGHTLNNSWTITTGFAPAFSTVFNGSHWASGWPAQPSKVYKSVGNSYGDFGGSGSDAFPFQGTITGLAATNQALFYFTADNVYMTGLNDITTSGSPAVFSYFTRPLQTQEGSVNNQSIVTAGDSIYYVSPSNKIITISKGQAIYGFDTNYLSSRKYRGIEKIMATLDPDQSTCFGYYIPDKNVVKWFFKTAGSTFNNISIVYDIVKDAFLVDSNKYFIQGTWFGSTGYTASVFETKIFKDEFGQDDEDMPISFEYRSKRYDMGDPTMRKEFWEARTYIQINQLASVTQETYIDDSLVDSSTINSSNIPAVLGGIGVLPIGDFAIGDEIDNADEMQDVVWIRSKGNLRKRGKYIQFRWICNTLAAKLSLQGMDIRAEMLPPDSINRTSGT